ncbi:hypothetical protein [Sabulibacter ruber]|uniref:hypothetical protein n=1 Tax=Sabulibacter ruber TaxID=2811901 RepID=UPI001A96DBD0|nr:hypothetical protein [Sabulibacter ruber]
MLYSFQESPIQDVPFGTAMQTSLNNYYDLLKAQAASLNTQEFLQLKLVADPVDVSLPLNSQGTYEWYSYYNLLKRSDLEIEPGAVSGTGEVGVARISDIYGKFINRLSSLVVLQVLTPEEQKKKDQLETELDGLQTQMAILANSDFSAWRDYASLRGYNFGDMAAYNQYSSAYGVASKMERLMRIKINKTFELIKLINKTYASADDQEIINATVDYYNSSMRLCYPTYPDYTYLPTIINLNYLLGLPHVSTAVFDDRYAFNFDQSLDLIKTSQVGAFSAKYDRTTGNSSSITTDWGSSGSARWGFIKASASVTEHQQITEDFKKATEIKLSSKAAFRVGINYGPWFKPNLFKSKYIKEQPDLFAEFFNENGSLLYYPTALILIRGFSVEFSSSANWSFDYKKRFSASGGGGFRVFGINFGGKSNYTRDTKEHKVDQTSTTLNLSDDENTIRFVGYAVKKNKVWTEASERSFNNLKFAPQ